MDQSNSYVIQKLSYGQFLCLNRDITIIMIIICIASRSIMCCRSQMMFVIWKCSEHVWYTDECCLLQFTVSIFAIAASE